MTYFIAALATSNATVATAGAIVAIAAIADSVGPASGLSPSRSRSILPGTHALRSSRPAPPGVHRSIALLADVWHRVA